MGQEGHGMKAYGMRYDKTADNIGVIAMLCILLLAQGCGSHPRIARLTESSVVLAFGDSLTAGTGASNTESYPAVLADMLGCRVVNAGVPGEESSDALVRLPKVLQGEKVALVILCLGGNDMLRKQDDESIRRNLDAMVSMAHAAGADVILIGVPRPGLRLKVPAFYRQIAEKNGILCDQETIPQVLSTPSLKSDYVHPNAAGYRRLAEAIAALIRKSQRE
jgi:lysophospholipase L1-like esterase